jgi:hypothetical protein
MSINVEILGGSLLVEHHIEEIGEPDHLRLVSNASAIVTTDEVVDSISPLKTL